MAMDLGRIARRLVGVGRRESASLSAALLGVLLLAGAALGEGVSRTAVDVSDGLTWLGDDQRGEVVQVNPASGKPQTRLQVSGGDAQLEIAQSDDKLIVLDRRTGQITVVDLATLLASGRRQAPPGGSAKVLIVRGQVFVVDRAAGTVVNADPVTLVDVGEPWLAGGPLADVVADDAGVVWAVDHAGTLRALEWSDDAQRFVERSHRAVPGAGPRTVLVPHERGVTLLGLEGGVVVRDGTAADLTATTAAFTDEVLAARSSPTGLVPAALPGAGVVVLLSGDRVLRVEMGAFGCPTPGRPAVFRDKVYVPCKGSGKVVVLDGSGARGGDDLRAAGSGDPELVFDDGKLFINTPGAEQGVIVDADGSTKNVVIRSPDLPVTDPDRSPIPSVPSPPPPRPEPPTPGQNPRGEPSATTTVVSVAPSAGTSSPSTTAAAGGTPGRPAGVTVSLRGKDASAVVVSVGWSAAADNGDPVVGYTVTASGAFAGGSTSAQVAGTSTDLTLSCAGTAFCSGGRVDVTVAAYNGRGAGEAGAGSYTVPSTGAPVTTTPPPVVTTTTPPPVVTTTTPPPVITTTTTPPPVITTTTPPPPTMPAAGAAVITSLLNTGDVYSREASLAPPADWASHNGRCEVINTTYGYATAIACSAGSAVVSTDVGVNRFVVRAYAADGSTSVDSAPRSVTVRDVDSCPGTKICQVPRFAPESGSGPMVNGGLGLIATAFLLRFGRRRRTEGEVA
ncbi:hypothetical protein [Actinosynnema sp. NPDC020468]|uniref:hypothetical protein n=1 Tax=Actinosynnema sp. NPDC020468 TaxID=3154488 RepID=UPI0033F129DB